MCYCIYLNMQKEIQEITKLHPLKFSMWFQIYSFIKILFILIGGQLLYNIVMVFAIHQHELAIGVHVSLPPPILNPPIPPPSSPHPSRLSQSTGFGCPASCIELVLVICFTYGNVYPNIFLIDLIFESSILEKNFLEVWFICWSICR